MNNQFQPSDKILKKYADVLIKFALGSGNGIKKGDVVQCVVPDVAKPLYGALQTAIAEAGGHPLMKLIASGFTKDWYDIASDEQLTFFPKKYLKARADLIDHTVAIIAEHDLHELQDVPPSKIIKSSESRQQMRKWLNDKEAQGNFTWTLGLYGTPAMAKEAGLSLEEYWQQIIKACYLDKADPIATWKKTEQEVTRIKDTLTNLHIDRVHIEGENIDLWVKIGDKRKWMGGSGRNIPSFEVFTSPDWRGTNGHIFFNQPLYRYGSLIKDIRLEFKNGKVVKATASKNEQLLTEMIARKDANKVGEFSLTDKRLSKITKFMANTLFDENIGGTYGNTHIAIGMSYKDAFDGDLKTVSKKELDQLGFNNIYCAEHCDMMSTEDRTVTAYLADGTSQVIYRKGSFTV